MQFLQDGHTALMLASCQGQTEIVGMFHARSKKDRSLTDKVKDFLFWYPLANARLILWCLCTTNFNYRKLLKKRSKLRMLRQLLTHQVYFLRTQCFAARHVHIHNFPINNTYTNSEKPITKKSIAELLFKAAGKGDKGSVQLLLTMASLNDVNWEDEVLNELSITEICIVHVCCCMFFARV